MVKQMAKQIGTFEELWQKDVPSFEEIWEKKVPSFEEIRGPEERPGLLKRLGKSFLGSLTSIPRHIETRGSVGQMRISLNLLKKYEEETSVMLGMNVEDYRGFSYKERKELRKEFLRIHPEEAKRVEEERQKGMTKPFLESLSGVMAERKAASIEVAEQVEAKYEKLGLGLPPAAETFPEKAVDIVAGVAGFITKIAVTRKAFGLSATNPTLAQDVFVWETINLAEGGTPGTAAITRLALGAVGKIPAATTVGKGLRLGGQSSVLMTMTAASGGDAEDIMIAGLIPPAMKALQVTGIKAKAKVRSGLENRAVAIMRQEVTAKGLDLSKTPDSALKTILAYSKELKWWHKQFTKGKITEEVLQKRVGRLKAEVAPVFRAISKQQPLKAAEPTKPRTKADVVKEARTFLDKKKAFPQTPEDAQRALSIFREYLQTGDDAILADLPPGAEIKISPQDVSDSLAKTLTTSEKRQEFKTNLVTAISQVERGEAEWINLAGEVTAYQRIWGKEDPLPTGLLKYMGLEFLTSEVTSIKTELNQAYTELDELDSSRKQMSKNKKLRDLNKLSLEHNTEQRRVVNKRIDSLIEKRDAAPTVEVGASVFFNTLNTEIDAAFGNKDWDALIELENYASGLLRSVPDAQMEQAEKTLDKLARLLFEGARAQSEKIDTRLPAKILADRVLESVKLHESKIKPEQKQERARRAKLIDAEAKRLQEEEGLPFWEALPQAFKTHGTGALTGYDLFEPLWGKIDAKELFSKIESLDEGVYDKITVVRALKKVFDGIVNTEGEAKALGDIYGFEVRHALDQRIASNKALHAFGKLQEGKPLTIQEASLIGRFYPNLGKLAWKAVPRYDKILPLLKQMWFFRRTMVLGSDISLWMRQAKKDITRHPIEGTKAIGKSLKAYGIPFLKSNTKKAEVYTQSVIEEVKTFPNYNEAKAAGLNVYELPPMGVPISDVEGLEWYKGGELAERVPFFGRFVRAGQRAWIAGSNYFHVAKYNYDRQRFVDANGNITEKQAKALAGQINSELGRTRLPKGALTTTLQSTMLAPGFAASRLVNPLHPFRFLFQWNKDAVRLSRLSAESWTTFIGSNLLLLAGLKWMTGDEKDEKGRTKIEVNDDYTSSNFGKVRIENTRFDIWAGYAQPVRFSIQLALAIAEEKKTTVSGRKRDIDVRSLIAKFGRSKSSLLVGGVVDWYTEQNYIGEPFPPEEFKDKLGLGLESFSPMWIRDMVDAAIHDGVWMSLAAGPASFLGEGITSYDEKANITLQRYQDEAAIERFDVPYEQLNPKQQDKLHDWNVDLQLLEIKAASEKESPMELNKMARDRYKEGRVILKTLPLDIQEGMESVGLKSIGLSRTIKRKDRTFYYNDKRYEWYQQRVTELLHYPGNIKRLRKITEKAVITRKERFYLERVDKIKDKAREELGKLMSRGKI